MVVQFGNAAQRLLLPKVEAEPLPTGEIDLTNGNGSVKGTFFANSDAY